MGKGSSLVAKWVKDPAMSQQWLRWLLWCGLDRWPGDFHMLWVWPKKKSGEGLGLVQCFGAEGWLPFQHLWNGGQSVHLKGHPLNWVAVLRVVPDPSARHSMAELSAPLCLLNIYSTPLLKNVPPPTDTMIFLCVLKSPCRPPASNTGCILE